MIKDDTRLTGETVFSRAWAMPSPHTFSIAPIADLLDRWLPKDVNTIIDPFSGDSTRAGVRNDLRDGLEACEWLTKIAETKQMFNAALVDPPYSPRQISECYKGVGRKVTQTDTQTAALYKRVKTYLDTLLVPGGIAICFGWNSVGFGKARNYKLLEVLLVCHGGAHNDTIVTVEVKK